MVRRWPWDALTVVHLLFSPDGRRLAVGRDGLIVWDVATGTGGPVRRARRGPHGWTTWTWAPDGRLLAARRGDTDRPFQVWDVAAGKPVRSLVDSETRGQSSTYLEFSPDGRWAVWNPNGPLPRAGPGWKPARVYDLATGRAVAEFPLGDGPESQIAVPAAVRPDGRRVVTVRTPIRTEASAGDLTPGECVVRALPDGEVVTRAPAASEYAASGRAFSPDSKYLVLWPGDGTAHFLDAETGAVLIRWRPVGDRRPEYHGFTPDGWIATAARGSGELLLYDPAEVRRRLVDLGLGW